MRMLSVALPVAASSTPDIDVGGELLRVVLSLAGIVLLIFVAGWMSRRLQARQFTGGRRLRCLETLSVGTRERVLLLEADGKRLLIGVGTGGVRTLHVYDGVAPAVAAEPTPMPSFGEVLGRWRRR